MPLGVATDARLPMRARVHPRRNRKSHRKVSPRHPQSGARHQAELWSTPAVSIQCEIEFQYIDPRLAEDAKLAPFGVIQAQLPDLFLGHLARLGNACDLCI